MTKKTIHLIAAARPNFMKIAPLYHALKKEVWAQPVVVHTGQHYDLNMSDVFFQDLGMPAPAIHLGVGSGSHAEQTGQVMIAYEKILLEQKPDLVVVVGDVNSTVAATLAATKLYIKVAHLEAGLRSFDRTMPEEINRVVTDTLADILWTPSPDGDENLIREGVHREKIQRVGNIMIDSLEMLRPRIESEAIYQEWGMPDGEYGLVTLHRPANVDESDTLKKLCELLVLASKEKPILFPVHPRTQKNLDRYELTELLTDAENIYLAQPQSYIRFMNLVFHCAYVITDSGGIQEETSYLGIPCMTLRPNTERPVTITQGTNRLFNIMTLQKEIGKKGVFDQGRMQTSIDLWDGETAARVVTSIRKFLTN